MRPEFWLVSRRAVLKSLSLAGLSLAGCTGGDLPSPNSRGGSRVGDPLRRACEYLWSRQARDGNGDGGWHSATYSFLRSGQALTPFVLFALLQVDQESVPRPPGAVERALDFLRRHVRVDGTGVDAKGQLGLADPELPEYPSYATAFALRCFLVAGEPRDRPRIEVMTRTLRSDQIGARGEFDRASLAFGAWGFGGPRPLGGSPGHVDLSYTRHVLEALRDAGVDDGEMVERAETFLKLLQRHPSERRPQPPGDGSEAPYDGGFYFSPIVLAANKGGTGTSESGAEYFRSYATATCDGLLALLAAGVSADDERVEKARSWLRSHPRVDYPEGVPSDEHSGWGESIQFYHLAVRAEAYRALGWPETELKALAKHTASRQRDSDDGSFRNAHGHLMKEDDPILCTALAVVAMTR